MKPCTQFLYVLFLYRPSLKFTINELNKISCNWRKMKSWSIIVYYCITIIKKHLINWYNMSCYKFLADTCLEDFGRHKMRFSSTWKIVAWLDNVYYTNKCFLPFSLSLSLSLSLSPSFSFSFFNSLSLSLSFVFEEADLTSFFGACKELKKFSDAAASMMDWLKTKTFTTFARQKGAKKLTVHCIYL